MTSRTMTTDEMLSVLHEAYDLMMDEEWEEAQNRVYPLTTCVPSDPDRYRRDSVAGFIWYYLGLCSLQRNRNAMGTHYLWRAVRACPAFAPTYPLLRHHYATHGPWWMTVAVFAVTLFHLPRIVVYLWRKSGDSEDS